MLELKPLDNSVFPDFIDLLTERGEAPADYYRWKYIDQPSFGMPVGFVAFDEGRPVGCIGIVNRRFYDDSKVNRHVTWFADWYVQNGGRGKGVGISLLRKVASISPYGLGLPGPSMAANVAKLVGYEIDDSYRDFIFLCRPFEFGVKRYRSESTVKAAIRGIVNTLRYRNGHMGAGPRVLELLNAGEFSAELSSCAGKVQSPMIMDKDIIDWMSRMPALPNGNKEYWKCVDSSNDSFAFGFIERDYNELRKATVIFYSERALEKDFIRGMFGLLGDQGVHYVQLFARSAFKKENDLRCYSDNSLNLARLGNFHLNLFAFDRENIWFAHQRFN